jgi:regulator of cell morphogenesis and NO signaling
MTPNNNITTVAELATAMPAAMGVFERLGIDFCCHGDQTIHAASAAAGITPNELFALIVNEPAPAEERPWAAASMAEMIRFIVDTHHRYTRDAIARVPALAAKVRDVHQERHPELAEVARIVGELASELFPHMLKEEQVLFPYITALEQAIANGDEPPMPFFGTVKNPVRMMMMEHETAGEMLAELRVLTNGYEVPEDACTSYRILYERLRELEGDLHRHIHLENNVLFPRALNAEESVPAPQVAFAAGSCGGNCKH